LKSSRFTKILTLPRFAKNFCALALSHENLASSALLTETPALSRKSLRFLENPCAYSKNPVLTALTSKTPFFHTYFSKFPQND
jgi:hypothetical protein